MIATSGFLTALECTKFVLGKAALLLRGGKGKVEKGKETKRREEK